MALPCVKPRCTSLLSMNLPHYRVPIRDFRLDIER